VSWQSQISEEETVAEDVLLEIQRLWPPFLGGARVCTKVWRLCKGESFKLFQACSVDECFYNLPYTILAENMSSSFYITSYEILSCYSSWNNWPNGM